MSKHGEQATDDKNAIANAYDGLEPKAIRQWANNQLADGHPREKRCDYEMYIGALDLFLKHL